MTWRLKALIATLGVAALLIATGVWLDATIGEL